MDAGTRNVYAKKPVTRPADLKGMKIRMMGNPIFVETMNAMGGNGMPMGFNELYQALQTGVVDGAENNPPSLLAQNHYQSPRKFYSLTGHLILPEILVFSKASWDGLAEGRPGPHQQALARGAAGAARSCGTSMVAEATAKLKAGGDQFVEVDKKAFYEATQPVRDKYGAKYAALIQRIRDTK